MPFSLRPVASLAVRPSDAVGAPAEGRISMSSVKELSLVMPAFNEQAVILQAIAEAIQALETITPSFELIIIDDGSTDHTAGLVEAQAAVDPRVRLIRHDKNRGYGAALRTGYEAACGELVAMTDSDCQFDLSELSYLVKLASRFDIVSGYRIDRKDTTLRRFCSWGYNTLVQLLMGSPVRDIDCALKVFRRSSLAGILPQDTQFFANTEMLFRAREAGLRIVDVGVHHRERAAGSSKVRFTDVPKTLDALLPFWWTRHFSGEADYCSDGDTNATVSDRGWSIIAGLVVMFLASFLLLRNLNYPLIDPDEGRYAEIMREMVTTGDWIVPRLMGDAYLDKPPLLFWLGALMIQVFGPEAWVVRLVPAMAAWLTILVAFVFGRRLLGLRSAFLGALVLALTVGFNICGRFLTLDSLLTFCIFTSFMSGLEATRLRGRRKDFLWIASSAFCALGVLTKGPISIVLTIPPLVAHLWLTRTLTSLRLRHWLTFGAIVTAINAPWYILISLRLPGFVHYFFWEHNVGRFLTGSNHPAPTWFYLPVVLLGFMPWGLLLFPLTHFLCSRSRECRLQRPAALGVMALGAVWCIAFFSMSSGKLPAYVLPSFPLLALLIGHYLEMTHSPFSLSEKTQQAVQSLFMDGSTKLALCGIVFPMVLWQLRLESLPEAIGHSAAWGMICLIAILARKRVPAVVAWGTFSLVALMATHEATHDLFPSWAGHRAILNRSTKIATRLEDPSSSVGFLNQSHASVSFYLQRNDVVCLDQHDEIAAFLKSSPDVFLVTKSEEDLEHLDSFLPAGGRFETVTETPGGSIYRLVHEPSENSGVVQAANVELRSDEPTLIKTAHEVELAAPQ